MCGGVSCGGTQGLENEIYMKSIKSLDEDRNQVALESVQKS